MAILRSKSNVFKIRSAFAVLMNLFYVFVLSEKVFGYLSKHKNSTRFLNSKAKHI